REGARRGGWLGRREGANRSVAGCHVRIRARPRTTPDAPYRPAPLHESAVPAGEDAQANLVVGVVADQEPESVRGGGKGGRKIEREDLGSAKRRCVLADADRDGDHFPGRIHHVKLAAAGGPETLEHALGGDLPASGAAAEWDHVQIVRLPG